MSVPRPVAIAAALLALETLGLVALAVLLVVDTATGNPHSIWRALLGAALALVGAAVLGLGARGLVGLRPAARTPVVVLQVLAVPVAISLVQADQQRYGAPILIVAVAVVYLLFTPPARAALDREDPPTRRG
jgi:hypothetical protein